MKKVINLLIIAFVVSVFSVINTSATGTSTNVNYSSHVQMVGWQKEVSNGTLSGTTGKGYRLEGIKISLKNQEYSGNIEYSTHIQNIGWQGYVKNGALSGTTGKSLRLEAIKIRLTGEMANKYDVYYRVHAQNFGWMDWAKNDEKAGTAGYSYRLEAIEIKLVKKNDPAPGATAKPYIQRYVGYQSHVQNIGWQAKKYDGGLSGTTGKGLRVEAIKIALSNPEYNGNIEYSSHVQSIGWQGYVKNGALSGTTGKGLRVEAVKIRLTGEMANKYNIYYRVHVSTVGWMGWTSNDNMAGTSGAGLAVEAIEMKLVKKGDPAPVNTDNPKTTKPYLEAKWTTDSSGNKYYTNIYGTQITSGGYKIGDKTYYFGPTGIYLGTNNLKVIDISSHNGNVDWAKVAKSGIYGVILRISAGCDYEDSKLATNIAAVKKYNIPYGIYIYSYAENYNEGVLYAKFTNKMITKYSMNPTLGVYLDLESNGVTQYMGTAQYTNVVKGFLATKPSAKVYTYTSYANTALNTAYIRSKITWIAHYASKCGYTGKYNMWQYTSTGSISGVPGYVDISIKYN